MIDLYYKIYWFFKDLKYDIKWAYQRVVRGYDDRMAFEFCGMFPPMMAEILDTLNKTRCGYPCGLSDKRWGKILDEMRDGFLAMSERDESMISPDDPKYTELIDKENKALKLFAKHFNKLWD